MGRRSDTELKTAEQHLNSVTFADGPRLASIRRIHRVLDYGLVSKESCSEIESLRTHPVTSGNSMVLHVNCQQWDCGAEIVDLWMEGGSDNRRRAGGGAREVGGSGTGHVGLAESDGQLQVLLLLEPQPPQPLLLVALALRLGPLQLLVLTSKLEQAQRQTLEVGWSGRGWVGVRRGHRWRK